MAGATAESLISRGGGPHHRIRSPRGGATPQDSTPQGEPHHRIYLTYMPILTIPWEGPQRRIGSQGGGPRGIGSPGEGHIVGSDPPGGPHRGICFEFEYLGEFELIFQTALGYESGGCGTSFDYKNRMQKISCQCPFK
jgi:hypothetical protein